VVYPHGVISYMTVLFPGVHRLSKGVGVTSNFRWQNDDMNDVPYLGFSNIRYHHPKFSQHGDLVPRICAPLTFSVA